jgi:Ran GTPase-activating protein (RanGAP) involved in mRNA processing and transport
VARLAEVLPATSLTSVDLGANALGPQDAEALHGALAKGTRVERLHLDGNRLGAAGTTLLCSPIRHLHLSGTGLGPEPQLGQRFSSTLQTLQLGSNFLGAAGAELLACELRVNTSLTQLGMFNTAIGDSGAAFLAAALRVNNTLRSLDLALNGIGPAGAASLASALRQNKRLAELGVANNALGPKGARVLGDCLGESSLTSLALRSCQLGQEGMSIVLDSLRRAPFLLHCVIDGNGAKYEEAAAVRDFLDRNAELPRWWMRIGWVVHRSEDPGLLRACDAFTRLGFHRAVFQWLLPDPRPVA